MATNEGTIYLPLQHVKRGRGVPGYKGDNIKVVADPAKARAAADAKAAKDAQQSLTSKQQAVAQAEALGLSTDGSEKEIRERIAEATS